MTVDGNKPPGNKYFGKLGAARAREIGDLVDAVSALPDVRFDKVAAIRKAIRSGTYVVDSAKIAQRMIDEIP